MKRSPVAGVLLAALALPLLALSAARPALADEGWTVRSFQAQVQVRQDSTLDITETIDADFGSLRKHGIFRDIPVQYEHDAKNYRVYRLSLLGVSDGAGHGWQYSTSRKGAAVEIKIGDPNRTVSGRQAYVIHYTVAGALNGFPDHDELYWNVNGGLWPVPMTSVQATVQAPSAIQRVACFEGGTGSTEPCAVRTGGQTATYAATRPLATGEQLTMVAALPKGAVAEPPVYLERKPRTLPEYFDLTPLSIGLAVAVAALGVAGLAWQYWLHGRDRVYRTVYNTAQAAPEEAEPLLGSHQPVVVEFEPPEGLRPAQMGLLLHETADLKGFVATIVDLAVRGYLKITELEEPGLFGHHHDWRFDRLKDATGLAPFESAIFLGMFDGGVQSVKLSELRGKFAPKLEEARGALYGDSVKQGWFRVNPRLVRGLWLTGGIALGIAAVLLTVFLGASFGLGLPPLALLLVALGLVALHRVMPQKTAKGHELLRRTLGFNQYIYTAERYQQQMAEREKIFTTYLPYAIVFGCVTRWAAAFKDIDQAAATSGWYAGPGPFTAALFYSSLMDFSTQLGPALAYTPPSTGGGMGGSGFGGGAGGGGGGGGGGSW